MEVAFLCLLSKEEIILLLFQSHKNIFPTALTANVLPSGENINASAGSPKNRILSHFKVFTSQHLILPSLFKVNIYFPSGL